MNVLAGIYLLLWKNFKLKIRHPLVLLMEIGMPCLFSAILAAVRVMITFDGVANVTYYSPLTVDNWLPLDGKTVLYGPKTKLTEELMNGFANTSKATPQVLGFETEDSLVAYYIKENSDIICCGVVFENLPLEASNFTGLSDLTIRIRYPFVPKMLASLNIEKIDSFTWQTARLFPMFQPPGPRSYDTVEGGPPNYLDEGFLYLHHQIVKGIILLENASLKATLDSIQVNIQRFPAPPFVPDKFLFALQFFFPLILMLSFIYPSINLTKNIVLEKEQRLKEAMKMMGLDDWLHWTSWFVNSLFWNLPSLLIITVLLCFPFKEGLTIIGYSNPLLIFLFFLLYTINSISFSFLVSTWFSRANVAGVISGGMYFLTFLPYFQVNINYHDLPFLVKLTLCSVFNTNLGIGTLILSMWESEHVGLQWWNLTEPASPDDTLAAIHIFIMFIVNSIVYFLIALYIENVFPGEFGIPKRWNFFLELDYWRHVFGVKANVKGEEENSVAAAKQDDSDVEKLEVERDGPGVVRIEGLTKSYDKGKTWSLKSLDLVLKPGANVLLGHNGAGKTTLMSILSGLIPATSGTITVGGKDLSRQIELIRKDLGICPQFDVLFDFLTVQEHLWFYCKLKTIEDAKIGPEIDKTIAQLDLEPKRHKRADTLSGGMKRKLSVGISLVGGSTLVLLDEPTSGMDVFARRFIWEILIEERKHRNILLSTHFMEEADVLADKIAIIDAGSLKCFGSPMELKQKYGLGYLLSFAMREKADPRKLTELIHGHIPNSKLLSSVGTEVSFSLPESETIKFEKLFHAIESSLDRLGVVSYAISVTTMEEVFLRVGDFTKESTEQFNAFGKTDGDGTPAAGIVEQFRPNSLQMKTGFGHILQIYWSLLAKKLLFFVRNRFLVFAQFILPSMMLFLAIVIDRGQLEKAIYSPAMQLSIEPYKTLYITAFHDESEPGRVLSELYGNLIRSSGHDVQFNEKPFPNNTSTEAGTYLAIYGGENEAEYNIYYMMAAIFTQTAAAAGNSNNLTLTALFNNQAFHTSATSLVYLENVLLKYLLPQSNIQLAVWNEPLPRKQRDTLMFREFDSSLQVQLANSVLFSTCFLLASFIILLVKEKESNFKHIQQISGLHLAQYWSANFVLDYLFFFASTLVMALVVYVLRVDAFQTVPQLGYLLLTFATSGLAALPFIYLCSSAFTNPATAYVRVSLYMIIFGQTTFFAVLILQALAQVADFVDLFDTSRTLDTIFSALLPVYTLSISIFSIYQNYKSQEFCLGNITFLNVTYRVQDFCIDKYTDLFPMMKSCCPGKCEKLCFNFEENFLSWEKPGLGQYLASFAFQAILFWTILTVIETGRFNIRHLLLSIWWANQMKTGPASSEETVEGDDDVKREEARIGETDIETLAKTDSMIVKNLTKKYGKFTAVNSINFGVKRGEAFGILGINGAGKTTTFKMITGAEKITSGDIFVNGPAGPINAKTNISGVYKSIGYCPQFCGLLEQLTGRETLRFISRIRGIDESQIDAQVDSLAKVLFFTKHIDQLVSSYSGGTKRKLSFAVSCVGNPMIILVDEASTGVDPASRRCLWNAIQLIRNSGTSIAFTSHSMDECEVLANRLFIMISGKIACLNGPLNLKLKYGVGYYLQLKLRKQQQSETAVEDQMKKTTTKEEGAGTSEDLSLAAVSNYLTARWPACTLESSHNGLLSFRLKSADVKLSALFGDIERMKSSNTLPIQEYSVCQTSLEQIFLSFARKQHDS